MPPSPSTPDLIIRDAMLIDGSGKPASRGDLAVTDDRITGIGELSQVKGAREISAKGLALSPGFVDVHTHDDRALLSNPLMECKISQGVTTVVAGNCGISLAPLSLQGYPPPPLDIIAREAKPAVSDLRCLSVGARPRAAGAECRLSGRAFDASDRHDGGSFATPGQRKRDRNHAAPARAVDGARCDRPVDRIVLSAGGRCTDGRNRCPDKSRARPSWNSHHPHARRSLKPAGLRQRNDFDRRRRGRADRDLPPQGDRHSELRQGEGFAGADRGRAKTPKARPRRLPVHCVLDHAGPAPHFAGHQRHHHLVEEPPGVRRSDARRDRQEAQDHRRGCGRAADTRRRNLLHDG